IPTILPPQRHDLRHFREPTRLASLPTTAPFADYLLASQCNCNEATIYRTCQRYRHLGLAGLLQDERRGHSGRDLQITPVQRAQIVQLACLEPVAKGLHITHWSSVDLARQAVKDGI